MADWETVGSVKSNSEWETVARDVPTDENLKANRDRAKPDSTFEPPLGVTDALKETALAAVAPAEVAGSLISGTIGNVAGNVAGAGRDIVSRASGVPGGAANREGEERAASVQDKLTYQPRGKLAQKAVTGFGDLMQKLGLDKLGPMQPIHAPLPLSVPIKGVNRVEDAIPKLKREPGKAAEAVTGELQRQRDVMSGKKGVPEGKSKFEVASKDFDERMKPLRDTAFNDKAQMGTSQALAHIQRLEEKNPDAKVRAALKEVKETIKRASAGTKNSALPAAGAKITPADLKRIQGAGDKLSVEMADEVRQSINRMISQKGDAALDAHTKDVLMQVREALMHDAPESYKKYLTEYGKGASELDRFNPDATGLSKMTSTEPGFNPRADAQSRLEGIFKGTTKERDLKTLVDSTAHDPKQQQALRQSYTEWLTKSDPQKGELRGGDLMKRWESTRDAVRKSGLMTKEHADNMDKVVGDLRNASEGGRVARAMSGTLGAVLAPVVGRSPYTGARVAREYVGSAVASRMSAKQMKAVESLVMEIASDPAAAKILAAPPTPQNMERAKAIVPIGIIASMGAAASQSQPKEQ